MQNETDSRFLIIYQSWKIHAQGEIDTHVRAINIYLRW